jgi:4a-hydroxytetrahydrobiopterin dehydratase
MLSRADLLSRKSRPFEGHAAMNRAQIAQQLQALPEWRHEGGSLVRTFRFDDYYRTIAFVNALAWVVHREDHHPDLVVGYNRCEVRFNTHSVGGISENDFICAAKADAVYAQEFLPQSGAA